MSETYNSSTAPALTTIRYVTPTTKVQVHFIESACDAMLLSFRNHLDMSLVETQHDLSTVQHALSAYQAVGAGFDRLVEDFTKLSSDIENKTWALNELATSKT